MISNSLPKRNLQEAFTEVFPNEYQLQQSSQNPVKFEDDLHRYLKDINQKIHMLNKNGEKVYDKFANKIIKNQEYFWMLYFEECCGLLLHKPNNLSAISIKVIYPIQWNIGLSIDEQEPLYSWQAPQKFCALHVGDYKNLAISLKKFSTSFIQNLEKILQERAADQKGFLSKHQRYYHPSWFEKSVRNNLQQIRKKPELLNEDFVYMKEKRWFSTRSSVKRIDMTYSLNRSLLFYLSENDCFSEVLSLGYQAELLMKFLKYYAQSARKFQKPKLRSIIICLKNCFQSFKQKQDQIEANKNIFYDSKRGNQVFTQLSEQLFLINIVFQSITIKLDDQTKLLQEEQIKIEEQIVTKCKNIRQEGQKFQLKEKNKVHEQEIFASLNDKYQKISKKMIESSTWIIIAQDTIFTLFINQIDEKEPFKCIKPKDIKCGSDGMSKCLLFLQSYCTQMEKDLMKYSMNFTIQAYSHILLMKFIVSTIAFQVIKRDKRDSHYSFDQYTIPFEVNKLYQNFNSLCFKARMAVQKLFNYWKMQYQKQTLFQMNRGYEGYKVYAKKVYDQDEKMKQKIRSLFSQKEQQTQKLRKKINIFHEIIEKLQFQISRHQTSSCTCIIQDQYSPFAHSYNPISKKNFQQCSRCKQLKKYKRDLQSYRKQKQSCVVTAIPQSKQEIHGFFYGIASELCGLIQILLYSQVQQNDDHFMQESDYGQKILAKKDLSVMITLKKNQEFRMIHSRQQKVEDYVRYSSPETRLKWKKVSHSTINYARLSKLEKDNCPTLPEQKKILETFIENPSQNKFREHLIYSNLRKKPGYMNIDDFIGIGSCRIGKKTQIPTLLENIEKRRLSLNSLDDDFQWKKQLIWRSASSLTSLFSQQNQTFELEMFNIINKFLKKYKEGYTCEDFLSFPIIGPLISLLSKTITDRHLQMFPFIAMESQISQKKIKHHEVIKFIAQKALHQFRKLQKDESSRNENQFISQNKMHKTFILFATICCFTESLVSTQNNLAKYFALIIVLMKASSVSFTNKNQMSRIMELSKPIFQRALVSNLKAVKKYFIQFPQYLSDLVRNVDENISTDVEWQGLPGEGEFVFYGYSLASKDKYRINLSDGAILKNGKQVSGVPAEFKEQTFYKEIFGNSDFEVFPSASGHELQIRKNFNNFFKGNIDAQKDSASFNLSYQKFNFETKPTISLVFKYGGKKQEKWNLLKNQITDALKIPPIFNNNCFGWFSLEKSCVVYRPKLLSEMGKVKLIIFLKNRVLSHANLISNHNMESPMAFLCNSENNYFDKIILGKKTDSIAFKMFNSLQSHSSLAYIKSPDNTMKFLFFRNNLIFEQHPGIGIVPSIYKDYRISQKPFSAKYLPWEQSDQIPCLVLEKFERNELNSGLHQIKILIPDYPITKYGKMKIPKNVDEKTHFFCYELHDHFHDLRGYDRLSQLHLVALLISVNKGVNTLEGLSLSSNQYAIKVFKSCFNNRPLTEKEFKKLKNILQSAVYQKSITIVLMVQALLNLTQSLYNKDIELPFKVQNKKFASFKEFDQPQVRNLFGKCKTLYEWRQKKGLIPYRQKLPDFVAHLLNLSQQQSWSPTFSKFYAQSHPLLISLPNISAIKKKYKNLITEIRKYKNSIKPQKINHDKQIKEDKTFSIDFIHDKSSLLHTESKEELRQSYISHLQDQRDINSIAIDKERIIQDFLSFQQKASEARNEIIKILNWIRLQNKQHRDILASLRPTICELDFTSILKDPNYIYIFYPEIDKSTKDKLLQLIRFWMIFTVQLDSFERILYLFNSQQIDLVALLRECESPREDIQGKDYWLCFEAQMKIQIWLSQFQTFKTLMSDQVGSATQLNMGQGKTQTIIPMIILELIYGKEEKKIPRINLLNALYEESRINYFKFLSVSSFNIPIIQIPFQREVILNQNTILSIRSSLKSFGHQFFILLDQSSVHSMILKLRELSINNEDFKDFDKESVIFGNLTCFDIFDEVDAQMNPKKSFVYSVGSSTKLEEDEIRYEAFRLTLQRFAESFKQLYLEKFITFDETLDECQKQINEGKYPKGLRLLAGITESEQKKKKFRKIMFSKIFQGKNIPPDYLFYSKLKSGFQDQVKQYILNQGQDIELIPDFFGQEIKNTLYALRGFLAYGIFEHCLSQRFGVKYGKPNKQRSQFKRLAVPYEAADVPSKKNEYAQPDVAITLSFLTYFNTGLSFQYCKEALEKLKKMNHSSQQGNFQNWCYLLNKQQKQELLKLVPNAKSIRLDSLSQISHFYKIFQRNHRFISFWLIYCVFPSDMIQFNTSITSSSWDHSKVSYSIGFSGTKDNSKLFPTTIRLKTSENKRIRGTDGRMIDLLLQNTVGVVDIIQNENPKWLRFLQTALNQKASAVIDMGALLSGKPLKQIVQQIANNEKIKGGPFKGISFCDENSWKVYDLKMREYFAKGATLRDHETFVIFDEYRTRGADMKMSSDIRAALSLAPGSTKDSLMQAVGRLRKLGRNQKVVILMNNEIKTKIRETYGFEEEWPVYKKVKAIINWSCINSINETMKYMLHNSKLASIHLENMFSKSGAYMSVADTSLKGMYSRFLQYNTVENLSLKMLGKFKQEKNNIKIEKISQIFSKYGNSIQVKCQDFDDVCEREVEVVKEVHEEREETSYDLQPLPEECNEIIPNTKKNRPFQLFYFDEKFKVSENFHQCTDPLMNWSRLHYERTNQLMQDYYVYLTSKHLMMITQRQANILIQQGVNFGVSQKKDQMVVRFCDLSYKNKVIKKYDMQAAFAHAKFYNGVQNFPEKKEQRILSDLLKVRKDEKDPRNLESYFYYFLQRRRTFRQKYNGSTLEKLYKKNVMSFDLRYANQIEPDDSDLSLSENQQRSDSEDESLSISSIDD